MAIASMFLRDSYKKVTMTDFILILLGLFFMSCSKQTDPAAIAKLEGKQLIDHGKNIYGEYCVSCHGMNPHRDGPLGPGMTGSSIELLTRRVVHGDYPEGYQPKRKTQLMKEAPMPELKHDIKAIKAYIDSL